MTLVDIGALRAITYGLAVGDALGVPYEFKRRGTFFTAGMTGHGAHDQPAGTWSDDTSMTLATLDSIAECGGVDARDMRRRYERWAFDGEYTCDGVVFDIGNTAARALDTGHGLTDDLACGNGSLMRVAPLAVIPSLDAGDVRDVSAITHAHPTPVAACVSLVIIIRRLLAGDAKQIISECAWLRERDVGEVKSGGYCVDTLEAALWCLLTTEGYRQCVLKAVNLGGDTDTTAAVAGALAGACYGVECIPGEWLELLRGKSVIEGVLRKFV